MGILNVVITKERTWKIVIRAKPRDLCSFGWHCLSTKKASEGWCGNWLCGGAKNVFPRSLVDRWTPKGGQNNDSNDTFRGDEKWTDVAAMSGVECGLTKEAVLSLCSSSSRQWTARAQRGHEYSKTRFSLLSERWACSQCKWGNNCLLHSTER